MLSLASAAGTAMGRHTTAVAAVAALLVLSAVELTYWKHRVVEPAQRADRATDLFKEHHPSMSAGFEALRSGRLALWNPNQLAGLPFLAVPYTGLLYPGNAAHLLLEDPALAIDVTEIAHLVFGGTCMWLLVASLGLGWIPGLAAALTLMLSGWIGSQILFPVLVQGMTWLPATVLGVERTLRGGRFGPVLLALAVALQVLNGSTEFLLYNLVAAGLYALFTLVPRAFAGRVRGAVAEGALLLAAVGIGAGLAAVQLLPSLDLVLSSGRVGSVTLAEARYLGTVSPESFLAGTLATVGPVAVGVLPLLGVALGLGTGRHRSLWLYALCLGSAAALLAFGGAAYELYFQSPLGGLFRRPIKLLHLYAFAASILAALALARLEEWRAEGVGGRALWSLVGWLAAIGGGAGAAIWLAIHPVAGDSTNPHLLAALATLLVFGMVRQPGLRTAAILALLAVQGADLFTASRSEFVRPYTRPELSHRESALFRDLARDLGSGRIHLSSALKLDPALTFKQGTLRGLPVLMDKQPLATTRHLDFLSVAAGSPAAEGHATLTPGGRWELLDLASTRFYVLKTGEPFETHLARLARQPEASDFRRVRGGAGYRVYERTGWLPRAYAVPRARFLDSGEDVLAALASGDFDPRREVLLEAPEGEDARPEVASPADAFVAPVRIAVLEAERVEIAVDRGSR